MKKFAAVICIFVLVMCAGCAAKSPSAAQTGSVVSPSASQAAENLQTVQPSEPAASSSSASPAASSLAPAATPPADEPGRGRVFDITYEYPVHWIQTTDEQTDESTDIFINRYTIPSPSDGSILTIFGIRMEDEIATIVKNIDVPGVRDSLEKIVAAYLGGAAAGLDELVEIDGPGLIAWYAQGVNENGDDTFAIAFTDGTAIYALVAVGRPLEMSEAALSLPEILMSLELSGEPAKIDDALSQAISFNTQGIGGDGRGPDEIDDPIAQNVNPAFDENGAAEMASPAPTHEDQSALQDAENYVALTGSSESNVREQLAIDGYEPDAVEFALRNLSVDWDVEAAEAAQAYIDGTSLSRDDLIDQLVFDGFTTDQAEEAADHVIQ